MELPDEDLQKVVAGMVKKAEGGFSKNSLTSQASIGFFKEAAVMAITAVWCAPAAAPPTHLNICPTACTPARPGFGRNWF